MQVTRAAYLVLCVRGFCFETRGLVDVKGKGQMETYLVVGKEIGSPAGVQRQPSSRSSLAAVVYGMVRARRKHTIRGIPTGFKPSPDWQPIKDCVRQDEKGIQIKNHRGVENVRLEWSPFVKIIQILQHLHMALQMSRIIPFEQMSYEWFTTVFCLQFNLMKHA